MDRSHYYQIRLREALTERIERNPRYSLRAFAKTLGMDPGTFSQILSGRRYPSVKVARRIFTQLDFSPDDQARFLRSLAAAKESAGLRRISPELRRLARTPDTDAFAPRDLSIDLFKTVADWYHFAILELPFTKDFESDPRRIARSLGISEAETHSAIQRLLELELLEIRDGQLVRRDAQLTSADKHLTSAAHKRRQKQVLERSIHSLETDPLAERNHSAMTFAIDSRKLPEAKSRIEKFLAEMTQFLETGERDRVYEMVVNLFPLQIQIPNHPIPPEGSLP